MRSQKWNLESRILDLIHTVNPYTNTYTKTAILLTNPTNPNLPLSFTQSPKSTPNPNSNTTPSLLSIPPQTKSTLINTNSSLFPLINPNTNTNQHQCPINLMYFLTIYESVRIVFVVRADNLEAQVLDVAKAVSGIFGTKGNGQGQGDREEVMAEFMGGFGFLVDGVGDLKDREKYIEEFRKAKQSKQMNKKQYQIGKQLLNQVINNNKIILSNKKKPIPQIQTQLLTQIPEYKCTPKSLTNLYSHLLTAPQIKSLQSQSQQYYLQKSTNFLNVVRQAIQNKDIFNQVEAERKEAMQQEILGEVPVGVDFGVRDKEGKDGKEGKQGMKMKEEYAVQAAYFVLVGLQRYEQEMWIADQKEGYVGYNLKNDYPEWNDEDVLNVSVSGRILQIIFSPHTLYYNPQILQTAKYFHTLFHLLQPIPSLHIRQHEQSNLQILHEMLQKLIQFFYEYLSIHVQQLTKKQIAPIRLINLTGDIKLLIGFLKKLLNIDRTPYTDIARDIQDKIVYIVAAFFFSAWKCYEIYKGFWGQEQKNLFMVDLDRIFRNPQYLEFLFRHHKVEAAKIAKKMNEHFGDLCFKKKQYFLSIKFYTTGRLNSKIIDSYSLWFQSMLCSQQYDPNNILPGLQKLAQLGLIQQSRKWCYKFMDRIDENSEFISLLEDIADLNRSDNEKIMEEIAKLKFDQINIVDDQVMEVVMRDLDYEDWLCRKDLA